MRPIRKLFATDTPELLAVLRGDPRNNLFLIGNLLTMGIREPDLEYWGCDAQGRLAGVLMRYRANWALYDAGDADFAAMAAVVDRHPAGAGDADFAAMAAVVDRHPAGARAITGEYGLVSRLWEHIRNYEASEDHRSHFAVMQAMSEAPHAQQARRATEPDLPGLAALYAEAGEMSRDEVSLRRVLTHGRIFVAEDGGRIVSAALTNAETPEMAMIGGVFTLPAWRNRGHATACMRALCRDLLRQRLQPCLFYDNPRAGSVYRRLGFQEVGTWRLLRLRRKHMSSGGDDESS